MDLSNGYIERKGKGEGVVMGQELKQLLRAEAPTLSKSKPLTFEEVDQQHLVIVPCVL